MDPQPKSPPLTHDFKKETRRTTLLLSFQSLGVVYGCMSVAPIYVFETISPEDIDSEARVYELFSFIFWTMTIIPLLKYAFIVLRADDNGEGGIFALYSLLCRHAKVGLLPNESSDDNEVLNHAMVSPCKSKVESRARRAIEKHRSTHYLMLFIAMLGSCVMIGDGILIPALSVLSVSSSIQRSLYDRFIHSKSKANSLLKYVPVPTACAILLCLFILQRCGTHKIGFIFAPIIIIWLFFISAVGLHNIFYWDKHVLSAISPVYVYEFVSNINLKSWRSLGSILLCAAGSGSMFANLGHFSKKSIKITFVCVIYPCLTLCYAGQAAYMHKHYGTKNFTHLSQSVPERIRHIFIALSLLASAVGSQAAITATFSIINQCLALGCFPRVKVIHTSDKIHGRIYIPDINWVLMVFSLAITIGFHDMVEIGYATSSAIISGMLVTTCLISLIITLYWEKSMLVSAIFLMFFGSIELAYLSASMLNFHKGAWYLVLLLALSMMIMLTWHYGMMKKYKFDLENKVSTDWLSAINPGLEVSRIKGIGFIYTDILTGIPAFFTHFITNLPAFHEILIFVSFKSCPVPYVAPSRRYLTGRLGSKKYRIYRCIVRYGYCDPIRDTDDFEDQIIRSIGEFISVEETDSESLMSPEGIMFVVGNSSENGNGLLPLNEIEASVSLESSHETQGIQMSEPPKRRKVRFMLPNNFKKMGISVRQELQKLFNARESGTAYFLGHPHIKIREDANFLKRLVVLAYVFLDKNCREPPVALNIPHAALVEIGMVYTI